MRIKTVPKVIIGNNFFIVLNLESKCLQLFFSFHALRRNPYSGLRKHTENRYPYQMEHQYFFYTVYIVYFSVS